MRKTRATAALLVLVWALALWPAATVAQEFEFHAPALTVDANVPKAMRDLAERILPVYKESDQDRYLENLSVLQLVAGNYIAADDARRSLRDRRRDAATRADARTLLIDLYAHAKAAEARDALPFAQGFTQAFRGMVPNLSDRDAYAVTAWLGAPLAAFTEALQKEFDRLRGKERLGQAEAIHLVWTYLAFDAYRSFASVLESLGAEDDRRRYAIDNDVLIPTPSGAKIHARVVRPKNITQPLPALLEFTIFAADNDAKACAAHGYVGVVAYTRRVDRVNGNKPGAAAVVPFEHDGEDAAAVLRWIAQQPWSDGRVGMYGGTYAGFAAWAAAKHSPPALKAIATLDAMAPGIDFPAEAHIFRNTAYRWARVNTETERGPAEDDDAAWRTLDQAWYRSGKPYADLDRLANKSSQIFQRWLDHPTYDRYWQDMIPFRNQFARIAVPVLAMAGYHGSGEVGTLYYFTQHHRYRKDADHTLLIGAYDDSTLLDGPSAVVRGHAVDPVAHLDLRALRFQWFDHVFKGAAKPALLRDRVNYPMMGANEWRHAPTLQAMSNGALKLYLDPTALADRHRLVQSRPAATEWVAQNINFADRADAGWLPPRELTTKNLTAQHGVVFVGEPLEQATEVAGLLSGRLDFKLNKSDMDVYIALYGQRPGGDYVQLADPYEFRASHASSRVERRMLRAGKRQQLAFMSDQLMSRKLAPGSRLVLVLGINKRPDREINYGSGKVVSAESIADAKAPLHVQWYSGSYIEVPVRR